MLKLYNHELFQGNLKRKSYFEGWYFKHVSESLENVYSFIPGISLNSNDPHAFIQVINGISGETVYVTYKTKEFEWSSERLSIRIGNSVFTDRFMELDISDDSIDARGRIEYGSFVRYPKNLLSPGIMGWYSFVPRMECKHGIVSANHGIKGSLLINGSKIDFENGKGYIEKDWGTSFPEAWIWMQCNNFGNHDTSFSFSVAKIPWLGRFFMGFISFLYLNGKFHVYATYNKSVISEISHDSTYVKVKLENKDSILEVKAVKNRFGELRAPASGKMDRRIKESIDSTIDISLHDKTGKILYSDSGKRAGLEVIEEVFGYFEPPEDV